MNKSKLLKEAKMLETRLANVKKQIANEEKLRMQKLAGIITEGKYKSRLSKNLITETQSFEDWADVVLDMAVEGNIITPEDSNDDKVINALSNVWDEMGFDDYEESGQGISTSDYNKSLSLFQNELGAGLPQDIKKLATDLVISASPDFISNPESEDYDVYEFDFEEVNPKLLSFLKSLGKDSKYKTLGKNIEFNVEGHDVVMYIVGNQVAFEKK
jgi:hypothetical protein